VRRPSDREAEAMDEQLSKAWAPIEAVEGPTESEAADEHPLKA
jgi:hypothetical protein